jgi:hypothetical protein
LLPRLSSAETGNVLRGNLGMLVRPKLTGARLGSDRAGANGDLSVFWITNPDNSLEGNVAAATEGWGFFIHTRLGPRGLSAARWPALRPSRTPLRAFSGNAAHSCRMCLEAEADAVDSGDEPPVTPNSSPANWEPRLADGSPAETLILNFTCHHRWGSRKRGGMLACAYMQVARVYGGGGRAGARRFMVCWAANARLAARCSRHLSALAVAAT